MSIRDHLHKRLVDNGCWPDEATAILAGMAEDKDSRTLTERWHEDESAYPPQLIGVAWFGTRKAAIAYLKANKPMHFALAILGD